jgi:hypothetical protein
LHLAFSTGHQKKRQLPTVPASIVFDLGIRGQSTRKLSCGFFATDCEHVWQYPHHLIQVLNAATNGAARGSIATNVPYTLEQQ